MTVGLHTIFLVLAIVVLFICNFVPTIDADSKMIKRSKKQLSNSHLYECQWKRCSGRLNQKRKCQRIVKCYKKIISKMYCKQIHHTCDKQISMKGCRYCIEEQISYVSLRKGIFKLSLNDSTDCHDVQKCLNLRTGQQILHKTDRWIRTFCVKKVIDLYKQYRLDTKCRKKGLRNGAVRKSAYVHKGSDVTTLMPMTVLFPVSTSYPSSMYDRVTRPSTTLYYIGMPNKETILRETEDAKARTSENQKTNLEEEENTREDSSSGQNKKHLILGVTIIVSIIVVVLVIILVIVIKSKRIRYNKRRLEPDVPVTTCMSLSEQLRPNDNYYEERLYVSSGSGICMPTTRRQELILEPLPPTSCDSGVVTDYEDYDSSEQIRPSKLCDLKPKSTSIPIQNVEKDHLQGQCPYSCLVVSSSHSSLRLSRPYSLTDEKNNINNSKYFNEDIDNKINTFHNDFSQMDSTSSKRSSGTSQKSRLSITSYIKLDLTKNDTVENCNLFDMLYHDEGTQTKLLNIPNTIFNTAWQTSCTFTHMGGQLQMADSSVKLIVPRETLGKSESVDIYGSIHVDIKGLMEVLCLDDEYVVSPAPEYHLNGDWQTLIKKHMVVQIPYATSTYLDGNTVFVYTFSTSSGSITKSLIPEKPKENKELPDCYYVIDETDNVISIYTQHFSGFIVCRKCKESVQCPGTLDARIYGTNQMINGRREVRIKYAIWDHKINISDFENKLMIGNEQFQQLESQSIEFDEHMDENTKFIFQLKLLGDGSNHWQCLSDNDDVFFPLEQSVQLKKLIACCRTQPYNIEWVLTWKPGETPKKEFQCVISLTDDVSDKENNPNGQPCYIQHIPEVWQKREPPINEQSILNILEKELSQTQVQEMCRKCFLPEREVERDCRAVSKEEFMNKWLKKLLEIDDFKQKLDYYLRAVNAVSAVSAVSALEDLQFKGSIQSINHDLQAPQAMQEPLPFYMQRRSPCENSDDGDFVPIDTADVEETYPKLLETEI